MDHCYIIDVQIYIFKIDLPGPGVQWLIASSDWPTSAIVTLCLSWENFPSSSFSEGECAVCLLVYGGAQILDRTIIIHTFGELIRAYREGVIHVGSRLPWLARMYRHLWE